MSISTTDRPGPAAAVAPSLDPLVAHPVGRRWLPSGDAMRVLGVAAVMLGHVSDMVLFGEKPSRVDWWVANIFDAASRWAVPIFVMLSGALLLHSSRQESVKRFYQRRLTRLGVPILFWSPLFMLIAVYYTHWGSTAWHPTDGRDSIWVDLLRGQPYMHLHFVFRLMALYAITPMLREYVRHASWGLRAGMVGLLLSLAMGSSVIAAFTGAQTTAFSSLWPFLGFYLAGNVLRDVPVTRRGVIWCWVGFFVTAAMVACGTGWLVPAGHRPVAYPSTDMILYDFLSPPRVVMAVCVWFIFAYHVRASLAQSRWQRFFAWLAPLTLGMYLIHPLFREMLVIDGYRLHLSLFSSNAWLCLPLAALMLFVVSTALTWVMANIPVVNWIVGEGRTKKRK